MIRNIVFDMGQVLLRFDPAYFIERAGAADEDKDLLLREVYKSLEWARMDRGSLTEAEAAESMCRRLPERLHETVHALVDKWDRPILPVEGMEELIEELKQKGYGIYLLSNASYRQHEYWPRVPASRFFDGTLVSADVKLVKPHACSSTTRSTTPRGLSSAACTRSSSTTTSTSSARACAKRASRYNKKALSVKAERAFFSF